MSNRGTLRPFSQLALASVLALLAACNGDFVVGEGGVRSFDGSDTCNPDCAGRVCGDDGCGGSCGNCTGANLCNGLGTCYDPADCTPDCVDRECGDDGCGGDCAPNSCAVDETCNATGQCVADPVPPITNAVPSDTNGVPPVVSGDRPDGLFLDGFFPIGTFIPYPDDVAMHVARGVNTAVSIGQHAEYGDQQWDDIMSGAGLKVIRHPIGDLAADAAKPHLLAWAHRDEPDLDPWVSPWNTPPYIDYDLLNRIEDNYATWKAAAPRVPVYVNLIGSHILENGPYACNGPGDIDGSGTDLECYPRLIAAADWVSNDIYPIGGYLHREEWRYDITKAGEVFDKLRGYPPYSIQWTDKPVFGFVEGSFFDSGLGSRAATPHEVRALIWDQIIHEARGIWYFPQRVGPSGFLWDYMPAEIEAEVTLQNATMTALSNVLQDVINPVSVRATMSAAQLEAGWRDTPSGKYFFVLNTLATPVNGATITLTGIGAETSATVYGESRTEAITNGKITDDFGEFELHIYRVAP